MKKFNLLLSAVVLFLAGNSFVDAQNSKNPWAITVGAHAVDHNSITGPFNQYFKTDNWDIVPPLSKLSIIRNLNRSFDVDLTASVGEVDNNRLRIKDELFINAGLGLRYKLANGYILKEDSWFDPYIRVGAGYHRYDYTGLQFPLTAYYGNGDGNETYQLTEVEDLEKNHFVASLGAGFNLWFTKNFGLNVASDYNWLPAYGGNNYFDFFQHTVGVTFRFGKQDRDGDGIPDDEDACPDTPGIATNDPSTNGCPDTDGDGIFDKDDACPTEFGLAEFQGCPDTDGDGVPDKDDACPTVAGPVENNGCPWPDTDGDGILDKDDACPTVAGLAQYNGCPKTDKIVADEVTKALNDILFDFNKATIRPESKEKLDQAAAYIKDFPAGKFLIEGRTDKKGSDAYNLKLSRQRAASVVAALEARGAAPEQLKSRGVGEAKATVAETASDAERLSDRRVVVEAISAADWDAIQKSDVPAPKKSKK